jgi:hypothetical protein
MKSCKTPEFNRSLNDYDDFDDAGADDEDVGGGYSNGVDRGPIDGGSDDSSDDELDDSDFLSQLLRHTKAELLVGSVKGVSKLYLQGF